MSTMAIPEETATITPLVRRPAPATAGNSGADTVGTVVRMPQRRTTATVPAGTTASPAAAVPGAAPGAAVRGGRPTSGQVGSQAVTDPRADATVLDPMKSERALVAEMTRKIALATLEVLSGARSVQQLARWLDTRCFSALTTRARLHASACAAQDRRLSHDGAPGATAGAASGGACGTADNVRTLHRQPIVHSIHCSPVCPGVYETSVVIADSTRFRAIAMRFEESRGAWKVTALQIG
ncbi:Rv3235 family protein [Arthrobacter sp. A2-55]|uniref:Rv3235 family protein n=1 Tax=Arthrobacter sp. A2-55 TaxID=2897337 RepID=UPI0021CD31C3|nr:Rv3235 family protein [Arthrobacter sp. A2-55]MCU6480055.1 Rv3235 family protein [Arthrobacter sp. A2-55]